MSFGQPPVTEHIQTWNILTDEVTVLAKRFELICLKSLKRGALNDLWGKTNVLLPRNLLGAILAEESLAGIRRAMRKSIGVLFSPEDIVGGVRRLLNETALGELEDIRISLPDRKPRERKPRPTVPEPTSDASEPGETDHSPPSGPADDSELAE